MQDMKCKANHILKDCKYDKKVLKNLIVVDIDGMSLFDDCKTCKHSCEGIKWAKERFIGEGKIVRLCTMVRM